MMTEREEKIRQRAHEIWEREGRLHGQHDQHWERARTEIDQEGAGSTDEAAQMDSMKGVSADPSSGRRQPRKTVAQEALGADGPSKTRKSRSLSDPTTSAASGRKRSGSREVTSEGTKPDGAPPAQDRTTRRSAARSAPEGSAGAPTDSTGNLASSTAEGSAPARSARKLRKSGATQDQ